MCWCFEVEDTFEKSIIKIRNVRDKKLDLLGPKRKNDGVGNDHIEGKVVECVEMKIWENYSW